MTVCLVKTDLRGARVADKKQEAVGVMCQGSTIAASDRSGVTRPSPPPSQLARPDGPDSNHLRASGYEQSAKTQSNRLEGKRRDTWAKLPSTCVKAQGTCVSNSPSTDPLSHFRKEAHVKDVRKATGETRPLKRWNRPFGIAVSADIKVT